MPGWLPEDWVIFLGLIVSHRQPFGTHDFTMGRPGGKYVNICGSKMLAKDRGGELTLKVVSKDFPRQQSS